MEGKISRINNTTDLVIDRISSLPGFILGHILSFLPTKEAVATSILSKRWNFAWVTVHNLDFYHDAERARHTAENMIFVAQNMKFVRFVDRVLLLHDYGSLNKFSLEWNWGTISSHVSSWIKTAITRNVRELHLSLGGDGEGLRIPVSGFNCDSLQSLELYGNIYFSTAAMVCLPRLECMKLHAVIFTSKEACEKLISGCPKLHYLYLSIYLDEDFTYVISSASLRRLEIYFNCRSRLKLSASSLEYLSLNGLVSGIFVEKSLSSLVQADIRIDLGKNDILNNSIVEAVRAFDRAKFLTLSADVMRALSRATISLSTEFKRLVKLEAKNFCSSLQDLIQSSCNLEALRIFSQVPRLGTSNLHDLSTWNALVEVPRCLSNSLKKVYFGGYKGLEDEREMIRYMLEHGSALEVMQISCYSKGDGEKIELLQEVCEFPRKSPVCKVQFSVWPTKREFKPLL